MIFDATTFPHLTFVEGWEFEEASGDRTGTVNGKVLKDTGSLLGRVAGKTRPFAVDIPASTASRLATLADDNAFDPGNTSFGFFCWVKITAGGTGNPVLVRKGNVWRLDLASATQFRAYVMSGALQSVQNTAADAVVREGEWQFITVRVNRTTNTISMRVRTPGRTQTAIDGSNNLTGVNSLGDGSTIEVGINSQTKGFALDGFYFFTGEMTDADELSLYDSGNGSYFQAPPTITSPTAAVLEGENTIVEINGVNLNPSWTVGSPGSADVVVTGPVGVVKISQSTTTTSRINVLVQVPEGVSSGNVTFTIGTMSTVVPISAIPANQKWPDIAFPAGFDYNTRANFPVTANTASFNDINVPAGHFATGTTEASVVSAGNTHIIGGNNGCDFARTISVAYRKKGTTPWTQATFGGQNTITVQPHQYYLTDQFTLALLATDSLETREESVVPNSGVAKIAGHQNNEGGVNAYIGTSAVSQLTATGSVGSACNGTNGVAFGPFLLFTQGAVNTKVLEIGDSISYATSTELTSNHIGRAWRGQAGLAWINCSLGGDTFFVADAAGNIVLARDRARIACAQFVNTMITSFGHNDAGLDGTGSSLSIAGLQTRASNLIAKAKKIAKAKSRYSFEAWIETLSPFTVSGVDQTPINPFSDKFIFKVNAGNNPATSYNEQIRANPGVVGATRYVDRHLYTRLGATGTDQHKWLANLTNDGTHIVKTVFAGDQVSQARTTMVTNLSSLTPGIATITGGQGVISGSFTAHSGGTGTVTANLEVSTDNEVSWSVLGTNITTPFSASAAAGFYRARIAWTDATGATAYSNIVSATVTADALAPTVTSIAVDANGDILLTPSEDGVVLTNTTVADWSLTYGIGNTVATLTSVAMVAGSPDRIRFVTAAGTPIYRNDTNVRMSYVGGVDKVEDNVGNDLAAFTNVAVDTSVAPTAPVATAAVVSANGTTLTITFDKSVVRSMPTVVIAGKTITPNSTLPANPLVYTISPTVYAGDTVSVTVNGGTAITATNNSTQTAPPTTTTGGTVPVFNWGF